MLERRLHKAEDEWRERVMYDHVVVNDDVDRAVGRSSGSSPRREARDGAMSRILLVSGGSVAIHKACDLRASSPRAGTRCAIPDPERLEARQPAALRGADRPAGVHRRVRRAPSHGDGPHRPRALGRAFVVAPCTADLLARFALGLADDLATTTALALPTSVRASSARR
jgi:hypothetical protein